MLNVRVKKALLTILTACLTVLMTIGAILGFTPQLVKAATTDEVGATWTLVTNVSDLAAGDKVVIVSNTSAYALGTTQNTNNRKAESITKNADKTVTINTKIDVLTLETGTVSNTFAFKGTGGYLYCASSGKNNYLKTKASKDVAGSWSISITSAGVATIKSSITSTDRNQLMKNSSSALFACYSGGQHNVSIYKMKVATCDHTETKTEIVDATTHKVVCVDCKEVVTETVACTTTNWTISKSNNDGTHTITGNCVCGNKLEQPEDCKYETVTEGATTTFTCECGYSYFTTEETYTVTFSVPDMEGVKEFESVTVVKGSTVTLPEADAPAGYEFIGWVTKENQGIKAETPEVFDASTEITEDIKLYALYKYEKAGNTKITNVDQLKVGMTVVITDKDNKKALSTTQNNNNRGVAAFDENNIGTNVQLLTLQEGKTAGTYAFYTKNGASKGYLYAASSGSNHLKTQTTNNDNGSWTITFDSKGIPTITATGEYTRNTMQYNASSDLFSCYAPDKPQTALTLWEIGEPVVTYTTLSFGSASLTLGEELTMNYKVAMDDTYAGAEMTFTMADNTTTVTGTKVDGLYVYSLQVAPQYMGENIVAELKLGDTVLASKATYSVKEYVEYQLANSTSTEMTNLLNALLQYGAAAQMYKDYDTDNLVADLSNLGDIPEESNNFSLSPNNTGAAVSFKSAGVNFSSNNTLYIKLNDSLTGNIKLYVNNVEATLNGNVYYTEGLKATQFDDEFVFELRDGETVIQTLKYSVNAYAYALQNSTNVNMANLARALYNYGVSAEAYVATLGN